jgi:hypothetical protein
MNSSARSRKPSTIRGRTHQKRIAIYKKRVRF